METSTICPLPVWVRWKSALDTAKAAVAPDSTSQTAKPARVGPGQRERVARIGASQHLREVENLHAFERSGQFNLLLRASLRGAQRRSNPLFLFVVRWIASLRSQ